MKKVLTLIIVICSLETALGQSLIAKNDGKLWGFVDENDTYVVSPIYSMVEEFFGDYARVVLGGKVKKDNLPVDGKWGVVDIHGNLVCPTEYDFVKIGRSNLIAVNRGGSMKDNVIKGGKWGVYDLNANRMTIEPKFDYIGGFQKGVSVVKENNNYGLIDENGNYLISCSNNEMSSIFDNGRIWAKKGGKWALYNIEGQQITDFLYKNCGNFVEGVAWIQNDNSLFGLINENGEIILEPRYTNVRPFFNGVSAVFSEKGQLGLVNVKGKEIARTLYTATAERFGVTQFKTTDKVYSYLTHPQIGNVWIDADGNVVTRGAKLAYKLTDKIPEVFWDF